ncbi:6-phosphogluconolactonase [Flavobacterium sp. MAH-1]|uniref:6-phosphogluconolactonase n=1 Tax=Flavobacterium agri TaxID=2743471 RepID=A0A7Y8Y072_9FLAO|nr:6-phosphogluconolactonase [Flavobacterium agri]NUY79528.1 6-phosphogluconolactonase [Flavobacterium agri]NYA69553.1 6-phosphogluconolactonase [Flavobacterium agri]
MIRIFQDKNQLSQAAAEIFIASAQEAVSKKGKFTVALTGGSSPAILYALLSDAENRGKIDWQNTFVFWGDERWVPIEDEKSNAGAAFASLLDKIALPKENIFPMWKAGTQPEGRAKEYEKILREHLGDSGEFDLILSGMGDDGHTASLFPGTEVLHEKTKWVDAYYLAPQQMFRITLTAPLLNKAKKNVVLVFGANKAHAFSQVISGKYNPEQYPSQLLKPVTGELIWLVDEAAAAELPSSVNAIKE